MTQELSAIFTELKRIAARLDELGTNGGPEVILTREQAAKQLKVSGRQLQRLIRAGRIMAHPSGVARAELERYARTPQTRLTAGATRVRRSSVTEEAASLRELLKLRRKRRP
jgi:excisionase family DNA binding protein